MIRCLLIPLLVLQEAADPWTRFPDGTRAEFAASSEGADAKSAWTELHRIDGAGGRRSHTWSDSRRPGDTIAVVVSRKTLRQFLSSFTEESREKASLEVDGKPVACTRTEFRSGPRTVRVWAAADAHLPARWAPSGPLLPPQVLQIEHVEEHGERRGFRRARIVRRGVKLRAAGVEWFCDQEEVLEETTGAGADDHRTNTLRWLCGDVPGHVVREEARFTRATAEARVTRELIDLKIPR